MGVVDQEKNGPLVAYCFQQIDQRSLH